MESTPDLDEIVRVIRELRDMGAYRMNVKGVEVEFSAASLTRQTPRRSDVSFKEEPLVPGLGLPESLVFGSAD